jgi:hypothetical protein
LSNLKVRLFLSRIAKARNPSRAAADRDNIMPSALAHDFKHTSTTKLPLKHYGRSATYAFACGMVAFNLYHGQAAKLAEVLLGQIVLCYLLVGSLGELYHHKSLIHDDKTMKQRRWEQSRQEIVLAVEALVGVCAFSCAVYEIIDPAWCPYFGYFEKHPYSAGWLAANVGFYLVFCDAWFYWWHYAFHVFESLWPMHYQHHRARAQPLAQTRSLSPAEEGARSRLCLVLCRLKVVPLHRALPPADPLGAADVLIRPRVSFCPQSSVSRPPSADPPYTWSSSSSSTPSATIWCST